MLAAIAQTTLNDDVFREDSTTIGFEKEIAHRCGHQAAAFVITGTMANQLALRALLSQPPQSILADSHAHIIHYEAGGPAHISGAMIQAIRPMNGRYLTLEDVQKHAVITDDVHKAPTRVISLENTTSGTIIPLDELRRIRTWATSKGVKIHMDGARLWEAVAAGAGTLREFAQCVDVLALDFSKNLGAPMGAMVVGDAELIQRLRRIRKSLGGGMRQAGVLAAAARQAVLENFGPGQTDSRGVLPRSHDLARAVGDMWSQTGGKLMREVETNMVWLDLKDAGVEEAEWNAAGRRHGVRLDGKRVVVHHQICDEAMNRLSRAMDDVLHARCVRQGEQGAATASFSCRSKL